MTQNFHVPTSSWVWTLASCFPKCFFRLSGTQFWWTKKDDPEHHFVDGRQKSLPGNCLHHCWVHMLLLRSGIAVHSSQIRQSKHQCRHSQLILHSENNCTACASRPVQNGPSFWKTNLCFCHFWDWVHNFYLKLPFPILWINSWKWRVYN